MCGFTAAVGRPGSVDREVLIAMRDAMVHRGPDEAGIWISPDARVGFGHRRLSIIDLEHGQQPMANRDGTMVLAYNGEIYNHPELRRELERSGRRFSTRCDTEVLLAAYECWGVSCLDRLDGMFALAIWDEARSRLFFARDRLGKKPLYFTRIDEGWAFASEIKGLLAHPAVGRAVDREAFAHYLSFLVTPAPTTLFKGISKLPAAHCGSWSERDGLETRRWWSPPRAHDNDETLEEAAERALDLLSRAVEKRMMSDVPVGVYLSGGVDSSANVALMSRLTEEPLRTFSVAFAGEPSLDELGHARHVAERYGARHREVIVDDAMVIASLPELIHHQDEPIADPVCVPLLHLAHLTKREGVTVVQIGEGADEIFRGYGIYSQVFGAAPALFNARRVAPRPLLLRALRAASPLFGDLKLEFMAESVRRGVPPAHAIAGFSERDKRKLLIDAGSVTAHDFLHRLFGGAQSLEEISSVSLEHELALRLSELLLMRVDKMTMAASVEGRAPFLDHELVEFAASLPLRLHWADGSGKLVLKRALRGILPDGVLDRRKQGFGAPVWRWMSVLRPVAERELFREPIAEFLDLAVVRDLVNRPPSLRSGFELWVLLNFALWHRHFIEGGDLRETFAPTLTAAA